MSLRHAVALAAGVTRHGASLAALLRAAQAASDDRPVLIADGEGWSARDLWRITRRTATAMRGSRSPIVTDATGAEAIAVVIAAQLARRAVLPIDTRLHGQDALRTSVPETARGLLTLTTGTTGAPRARPAATGVGHVRRMLALHEAIGLARGDVVLSCTPLQHGHGLSLLASCLLAGATFVDAAHVSPTSRIDRMRALDVTVVSAVPVQLERMLDADRTLPSARRIIVGSEPLSAALARRAIEAWGPIVLQAYGTTETGTVTVAAPEVLAADGTTVGAPLPGVHVTIDEPDEAGVGRVRVTAGGATIDTGDRGSMRDGLLRLHGRSAPTRPAATLDAVHTIDGADLR